MHSRATGMMGSDKKPQPMPMSGRELLSRTSVSFPDPNSLLLRTGSAGHLIGGCQVSMELIPITTFKVNGKRDLKSGSRLLVALEPKTEESIAVVI